MDICRGLKSKPVCWGPGKASEDVGGDCVKLKPDEASPGEAFVMEGEGGIEDSKPFWKRGSVGESVCIRGRRGRNGCGKSVENGVVD